MATGFRNPETPFQEYQELILSNNLDKTGTGTNTSFVNTVSANTLDQKVTHLCLTGMYLLPRTGPIFPLKASDISIVLKKPILTAKPCFFATDDVLDSGDPLVLLPPFELPGPFVPITVGDLSYPFPAPDAVFYSIEDLTAVLVANNAAFNTDVLATMAIGTYTEKREIWTAYSDYQATFWHGYDKNGAYVVNPDMSTQFNLVISDGSVSSSRGTTSCWLGVDVFNDFNELVQLYEPGLTFEGFEDYTTTSHVTEILEMVFVDDNGDTHVLAKWDISLNYPATQALGSKYLTEASMNPTNVAVENHVQDLITYLNISSPIMVSKKPPEAPAALIAKKTFMGTPYARKNKVGAFLPDTTPDSNKIFEILCPNLDLSYLTSEAVHILKTVFTKTNVNTVTPIFVDVPYGQIEWKPVYTDNVYEVTIFIADGSGAEHKLLSSLNGLVDVYLKVKARNTPSFPESNHYFQ